MAVLRRLSILSKPAALAATFVIGATLTWVTVVRAQSANGPYSLFQFATLTGSGNTITATRVPVVTAAGATLYKDVTIQFEVDSDGNLRLAPDNPQVLDAPALVVSSFRAGSYVGPGSVLNGKTPVFVDGPGATDGGATSWSLSAGSGADKCTYPSSATWYAGPIANSPVAARLKKAGITSTAWSYGVASGPSAYDRCTDGSLFPNAGWGVGTLIGVSQSGSAITIASFTNHLSGNDFSAPIAQITFRVAP